jgi:hypothetical protein
VNRSIPDSGYPPEHTHKTINAVVTTPAGRTRARRDANDREPEKETAAGRILLRSARVVAGVRGQTSAHVHRWWSHLADPDHHRRGAAPAPLIAYGDAVSGDGSTGNDTA